MALIVQNRVPLRAGIASVSATIADVVAPTAPSGLQATTISSSQINLSWNASSDNVGVMQSGMSAYRIRRGGAFLADVAYPTTTYSDTGLAPSTTYSYAVAARDAAGNESAQSAAANATTNAAAGWLPFAGPTFTQGAGSQSWSFEPYDPPAATAFQLAAGSAALPSGVTLDSPGKLLVYNGTGPNASVSGVILEDVLVSEVDWQARSTAAGVFYSNNFTYRNTANTLLITNTADLLASRAGPSGGNDANIQWDSSNKLTGGGSLRLNMPVGSPGTYSNWAFSFAGIATSAKTTIKNEFYLQFAYYADSVYRDFWFGSRDDWGGKIAIIQAWNNSFDSGEVVIRREPRTPGGFLSGYRYRRTGGPMPMYAAVPAYGEYVYSNFINRGTPAITSVNTLQQRHGLVNNVSAFDGDANDPDQQHVPKLQSSGWTVIEVYMKQVASGTGSIVKVWVAPYGQPPQLVFGSMAANLPFIGELDGATVPVQLYTGAQLTNFPNKAVFWPTQDTFVAYDELIVSDNPINFPGGFAPPYTGIAAPVGDLGHVHPYAGLIDE